VRVQSLLNPDAEVEDIPTLTPALSRRERVVYAACFRLMPMGAGGEVKFPKRRMQVAAGFVQGALDPALEPGYEW
jgi:hypothetical protein